MHMLTHAYHWRNLLCRDILHVAKEDSAHISQTMHSLDCVQPRQKLPSAAAVPFKGAAASEAIKEWTQHHSAPAATTFQPRQTRTWEELISLKGTP